VPLPGDLTVHIMRLYDDPAAIIFLLEFKERGLVCGEHALLVGGVSALQGTWREPQLPTARHLFQKTFEIKGG